MMKSDREKEMKSLTSLSGSKIQTKLAIRVLQCEEFEYNGHNLFFYCFYYDTKTKRLNPLPKGISKLINNCIKS